MARHEADRVGQRLAHSLRPMEAPPELWERVGAAIATPPQPRSRVRRAAIPSIAVALASVAAFAVAPGAHPPSRAVSLHRAWTEQQTPLDLYTNSVAELAAFVREPVVFQAASHGGPAPRPRIEGARLVAGGAVLVALRTGPVPASLLVEPAVAAERKQITAECSDGYTVYSWTRGEVRYTMVSADAASAKVACRLCHA